VVDVRGRKEEEEEEEKEREGRREGFNSIRCSGWLAYSSEGIHRIHSL